MNKQTKKQAIKEAVIKCPYRDECGNYHEKQIKGLILVMQQVEGGNMIARSYVIEKLNMILSGGIGFHSSILEKLE